MYLMGLRGLSTDRVRCSGGPFQRPSSAPAFQLATPQQAFPPSYTP
ncbi:hypothetical protein D187_000006 [Cystobacter fuscus DSM 2262]|uniref:Uncharacterized protein n=1 Tax=Cystobacter fuscus (strain ATCC 25194 / DSM 2262 / NBRC 100088 / M29) TaxID=1242864 RepID=S9QTH3_CYSF2|nr:hypothetical protein D187_000006 [Cystobacter fuscus DSM 2262]